MISIHAISKHDVLVMLSDNDSPQEAAALFQQIVQSAYKTITVDCSALQHLRHDLLAKVFRFFVDLRIEGKKLVLRGCSQEIRSVLYLIKLDQCIEAAAEPDDGFQA